MNNIYIKNSIRDKRIFNLYVVAFFILFLQSFHVWFLWHTFFKVICPLFFIVISYLNRRKNPEIYSFGHYRHIHAIVFIIIFLALRGSYDAGLLSIGKALIGVVALYDVLLLSQYACIHFIRKITKTFGIITIISLIGWIPFLLGIPLPHDYIVNKEYGYTFQNYFVFLYGEAASFLFPRFCSIFLEPGYYGQMAAAILFANKMKINNIFTIAIFIGVLFSLSLTGYVLVVLGVVFTYVHKRNIKSFVFLTILGSSLLYGVGSYNGGNNAVNLLIFSRMEFEDGEMKGYNRTGDDFDSYMKNQFMRNGLFLFGHGSAFEKMKWEHGVAGYRVYLAQNGYVGLFLAVFAYWLILKRIPKTKKNDETFFILFMIIYWQAAYPFWFCYFAIFVTGLAHLRSDSKNLITHKNDISMYCHA